jgi:hypothetical protein
MGNLDSWPGETIPVTIGSGASHLSKAILRFPIIAHIDTRAHQLRYLFR